MTRIRVGTAARVLPVAALALFGLLGCGKSDGKTANGAAANKGTATSAPADPAEDESAEPAKAAVDPCKLVSQQEAEKLAGTRLNSAQPVRETCTYTGPVSGPTAQVEIYVGDGAKKFLEIDRDLGHDLQPVSGIGDEAHLEDGTIFFAKSGTWVSIRLVRLNDPAENRKPLEEAARKAASRM
ncbi:DUF3558 family protein [Dactylosporangium sp. NPDC051484]|uniref:DUF3558 family protein n=1 Tax=Dactylosporangium sp. NPDC051484 TaxID=3154942 RepID=UPI00344D6529